MKYNIRKIVFVSVLGLFCTFCQTNANELALVKSFRTLGIGMSTTQVSYELDGIVKEVRIREGLMSRYYRVSPQPFVDFFNQSTDATGKIVRDLMGRAVLSEVNSRSVLLIFAPHPKEKGKYQILPLPEDLENLPAPSHVFINLTPAPLGVTVGKDKKMVNANSYGIIKPDLSSDDKSEVKFVTVLIATEDGPKRLYTNDWSISPKLRTLVFMTLSDGVFDLNLINDNTLLYNPEVSE